MRFFRVLIVLAAILGHSSAVTAQGPQPIVYVDCVAAPGGDGTRRAPVSTIGAAMSLARNLGSSRRIRIDVAPGVCDKETLPIRLDVPVWVQGARTPPVSDDEPPAGNQTQDTIVTAPDLTATFFVIEVPNVRISHLSLLGARSLGPDGDRPPAMTPIGVLAIGIGDFGLSHLRIEGMGQAIRSEASGGTISNNYLSADVGISLSGGASASPPLVSVTNNRVIYRVNGITLAGAAMFGTHLRARITDNDIVTSFANSGPTNPAALRLSPLFAALANTPGNIDVAVVGNLFAGPAKYGIIIYAGQLTRRVDSASYTGTVTAHFADNIIDDAVPSRSLITFTNARATVFPCELDPALPPGPACTTLSIPPVYWEYLTNARYDLRHAGELDAGLIDHPELHPVDGYNLGNLLVVNGEPVAYHTFVVVP